MEGKGFPLIPADIVKAWSRGEYHVGDVPSISYQHLGVALLLRGWYTYVDETQTGPAKKWAGIAKVDIKGSVLSMGGIRLFDKYPIFWRTEHSYIQDNQIIWFYSGFNSAPVETRDLREKYFSKEWQLKKHSKHFGIPDADWDSLLLKLANDFDEDVERVFRHCDAANKDSGMLRFSTYLEEKKVVRKCEYYHFNSAAKKAIAGISFFQKVL